MNTYKGVMIILDGLGDRGIPGFGGKTPLESAVTPNMDSLASEGQTGLIDPISPGVPLDTHTAMALLFGLPDREAMQLARGPVEAAGSGLPLDPEAIYFRGNMATLDLSLSRPAILDRRAGRIDTELDSLLEDLKGIKLGNSTQASVYQATQHRVVVEITGPALSPSVTATDPGSGLSHLGLLECRAQHADDVAASNTAQIVNRLSRLFSERLSPHPVNRQRRDKQLPVANGILLRNPGRPPKPETRLAKLGLKTAVVAGEKTILGLADLLGYDCLTDERFSCRDDTDIAKKLILARSATRQYDLVYLHIKAPDICSHDLDPKGKKAFLEKFDYALDLLTGEELVIGITGDHSSDSNTGRHTGDPVPGLLYAPMGRVDKTHDFSEASCGIGGLGRISSRSFFVTMLDMMNRLNNSTAADSRFFP
jgi:2,3-bisphosphoglycerate-independent phosphoglycerate mutase